MQLLQLQHQNRMFPCSVKEANKSRCLSADVMVLCEKKQKRRKDYKTITESETCIEIEKKKTKVFQFFLLFQLSRHSVNHTTTSPHPVFFFFFFFKYRHTHTQHTHTRWNVWCSPLRRPAPVMPGLQLNHWRNRKRVTREEGGGHHCAAGKIGMPSAECVSEHMQELLGGEPKPWAQHSVMHFLALSVCSSQLA